MYRFRFCFFLILCQIFNGTGDICMNQFIHQFFCPFNDRVGYTGQFGNLNTVTLVCTALDDFTQKYNIIAFFFYGNTVIIDSRNLSFQFCQFMIMGGKECLGSQKPCVADMFNHCPGNGKPVEGTGASADLIKNQKTF